MLGSDVTVKTLYGDIKMKIDPGIQNEEKKKLANYGVQKLPPNHHQKGNHFVTIKIVIPKKLSEEQKRAMEQYAKLEDLVMPG